MSHIGHHTEQNEQRKRVAYAVFVLNGLGLALKANKLLRPQLAHASKMVNISQTFQKELLFFFSVFVPEQFGPRYSKASAYVFSAINEDN